MNTYVAFVAAVAVLSQSISAQCINYGSSSLLLSTPIISPVVSAPCVSAPVVSAPYVSAPVVPTTTIVQTNCDSVADQLCDVLQLLPVCKLLNNQLPLGPNLVGLPYTSVLSSPYLCPPVLSPCGCGSYVTPCGCGTVLI